jgi:uncharacterized protein (TIGR02118 family)
MISYFVRYRGEAADPATFAAYYANEHATILKRFPAIRSLTLHEPLAFSDPYPVRSDGTALLAQMVFATPPDLARALNSEARRQAREDFSRFPPFAGEVTHQAMRATVIF